MFQWKLNNIKSRVCGIVVWANVVGGIVRLVEMSNKSSGKEN